VRYESLTLRAADGVELVAWFMPATGKAHATVLFLHGNAENISTHFISVAWMPAEGFHVLALDYRGYGGRRAKPSLPGMQLDIDAALTELRARPDVDPRRIVLFGQSLGGALAIHYAARGSQRGAAASGDRRQRVCRLPEDRQRETRRIRRHLAFPVAAGARRRQRLFAAGFGRSDQPSTAAADPRRSRRSRARRITRSVFTRQRECRKSSGCCPAWGTSSRCATQLCDGGLATTCAGSWIERCCPA
jgi:pimeloyl-ACP methyl ester carboxylesterase